jgi:hypothetical protein
MRIEYRVIVTWGTNPGATFSTSESRKDAEKLRALAIRKKYYDARIERVEVVIGRFITSHREALHNQPIGFMFGNVTGV